MNLPGIHQWKHLLWSLDLRTGRVIRYENGFEIWGDWAWRG